MILSAAPAGSPVARFDHPGLLYRNSDDYVAGTVPFVTAALAAGQPVLVAVPADNLELIRRGLGGDAGRVAFADMRQAGRNPGRIIPAVLLRFADAHRGSRVSVIGEPIWPGRTEVEYPACAAHEALINAAFAGRDAEILCPYDVERLDARAVADAHRTHPVLTAGGKDWASTDYGDPVETAGSFNLPLPDPPVDAARFAYQDHTALAGLRRFVTDHAVAAGVSEDRVTGLTLAVNELATNTIEHSPGGGQIAVWPEPSILVCQVEDSGHLANPLAGRIPVPPEALRGRGLVLVNQVCDLVRIHTHPGGTRFRLHFGR